MTDTFTITVDDAKAQRWFGELTRRGRDLSGLMADIGEALWNPRRRASTPASDQTALPGRR